MNTTTRYGVWLRIIHWLTFLLVAGALLMVELHEFAPKGSALRNGMMYAHMQFGIAVLLVFLPHLIVRLRNTAPPIVPTPPAWQKLLSKLVHLVLFVLILVQPIMGILMVQAHGFDVNFLGMNLPALVAKDKEFGHTLGEVHEVLGNTLMYLALFHAAAALWHQWIEKDNTLARMGFGRR
jgi:superoxide oxidase